jgi:muramoyltetrapeptide carboxypeptidase
MVTPPRLRPGDAIAVVAPAGPVPRSEFEAGAQILAGRYRVVHSQRILEKTGYLAGGDDERLAELTAALADPRVRAVVCARGGYGLMRIVERLDGAKLRAAPKWIVGFSDATVLHAWAARAGVRSLHAPVVTQLGKLPREDAEALFARLESDEPAPAIAGLRAHAPGVAEGPLVGGNLELITSLTGTPFAAPLDGAIMFLEDVGERPYRLDRALTQLRLSGALDRLAGVVLGDFTNCEEPGGAPPDAAAGRVERLGRLGVPLASGLPVGHGTRNLALVHGARARLDAGAGTLTFTGEGAP